MTRRRPPPATSPAAIRARGERGFTVLEVALATCVMAFGVATALIAMQMGFKSLDVARGTTLASQVLQSEMESLRLMSWSKVEALPASATYHTAAFTTPEGAAVAANYPITRTITNVADRDGEMKEITLQVTWQGADGRSHTRRFRTYYSKNGLYDYYYSIAGGS